MCSNKELEKTMPVTTNTFCPLEQEPFRKWAASQDMAALVVTIIVLQVETQLTLS